VVNRYFYVNVNEENPGPVLFCGAHTVVLYCDGDFNWLGQVLGGGRFDPSLAVRLVAPTTHSISCLDSSLGRVPACDAGDLGSIPNGSKLNAWDTVPF
jgi:hypothetical protein